MYLDTFYLSKSSIRGKENTQSFFPRERDGNVESLSNDAFFQLMTLTNNFKSHILKEMLAEDQLIQEKV